MELFPMAASAISGMIYLFISLNSNFLLQPEFEIAKGIEGLAYI